MRRLTWEWALEALRSGGGLSVRFDPVAMQWVITAAPAVKPAFDAAQDQWSLKHG